MRQCTRKLLGHDRLYECKGYALSIIYHIPPGSNIPLCHFVKFTKKFSLPVVSFTLKDAPVLDAQMDIHAKYNYLVTHDLKCTLTNIFRNKFYELLSKWTFFKSMYQSCMNVKSANHPMYVRLHTSVAFRDVNLNFLSDKFIG